MPCSSTTRRAIDKRRLSSNSACLKGADTLFHGILIAVGRDTGGGELVWSGIFANEILNVPLVAPEPRVLWTKGDRS